MLNVVYSTNVGKTEYLLRILETKYENHFEVIVIMCPTILDNNKTYLSGSGFSMIRMYLLCVMWKENETNGSNYSEIQ